MKSEKKQVFYSHSLEETQEVGSWLAPRLKSGDSVSLSGQLGAGKTVLVRGLSRYLNYQGVVRSPSFTLVNQYPAKIPILHVDLYRLEVSSELLALNLDEEREESILLVEWGERFLEEWGPADFMVNIEIVNDSSDRIITVRWYE